MAISTTFTLKFAGAAVERGLARVQSAFKSLGGVAMNVGKSLLSPFAALTALLGTGALVSGLMSFVKGSSSAAASVEDLTIQLEVLTGSFETAKSLIKQFREEEKKSALNLEDYSKAAKTILAFGGSVQDIMPTLRMLGDVSMGNSDRFGSLALAFAQTTASGRLMGQEVLQFVNAGFNPLEQISRDTGRSMKDLKKDMEDGSISVAMVKQAFANATSIGGRFFRAIDKGSSGTNAKINQFGAAVTELKVAFGTGFNDGLKVALDAANTKLPQLLSKFAEFGTLIGKTIQEAVGGDMTRLVRVGELIGTAIAGGMKIGIKAVGREIAQSFWETLENTNPIRKTDWGSKQGKISDAFKENKGDAVRKEIEDLVQTLRPMANLAKNPIPSKYLGGAVEPPSSTMDGNNVVKILSSIDRKLSPQP
jgi:tape measure domain-containing protein